MTRIDLPVREWVPDYHYESPQSRAILDSLTGASLAARAAVYDFVAQFWVASATWGLELWEELLDIAPPPGQSLEARRRAIISKMCGAGTCNSEMVRHLAQALTGYEAEVVEHPEDYTFSLRFVGDTPGVVPIDRQEIIDTVEAIKPAHLQFIIEAIKWSNLEEQGFTWADMERTFPVWSAFDGKFFINRRE